MLRNGIVNSDRDMQVQWIHEYHLAKNDPTWVTADIFKPVKPGSMARPKTSVNYKVTRSYKPRAKKPEAIDSESEASEDNSEDISESSADISADSSEDTSESSADISADTSESSADTSADISQSPTAHKLAIDAKTYDSVVVIHFSDGSYRVFATMAAALKWAQLNGSR
jgi:hypothetical protein